MISVRTFNKSKKDSVLLIHGLFGTSGFWLSYLKLFSDFKIYLVDISYVEYIDDSEEIDEDLINLVQTEKIDFVVAHSLGCTFKSVLSNSTNFVSICNVFIAEPKNRSHFINMLASKAELDKDSVESTLQMVDAFVIGKLGYWEKVNLKTEFIPNGDEFFDYKFQSNFTGDHFDINDAIKKYLGSL